MKTKHCQWCDNAFLTDINYQIYCSPSCREDATREKIAERYVISRRSKRMTQNRPCKSCGVKLSAYNDESICSNCLVNPADVSKALKEIKGLLNGKPWKDDPEAE
jgi:hypothetical protein